MLLLVAVLLWGIKRRQQWSKTQQQGGRPEVEGGGTGMSVKPEEEAGDVAGEAGIELSSSAGASDLALAT